MHSTKRKHIFLEKCENLFLFILGDVPTSRNDENDGSKDCHYFFKKCIQYLHKIDYPKKILFWSNAFTLSPITLVFKNDFYLPNTYIIIY